MRERDALVFRNAAPPRLKHSFENKLYGAYLFFFVFFFFGFPFGFFLVFFFVFFVTRMRLAPDVSERGRFSLVALSRPGKTLSVNVIRY